MVDLQKKKKALVPVACTTDAAPILKEWVNMHGGAYLSGDQTDGHRSGPQTRSIYEDMLRYTCNICTHRTSIPTGRGRHFGYEVNIILYGFRSSAVRVQTVCTGAI